MATIKRFEDLEIGQTAGKLCVNILKPSKKSSFNNDFKFRNQIFASSGLVMDHIAEGCERDRNSEFEQFPSIAKGFCGETKSQWYRAFDFEYIIEKDVNQILEEYQCLSGKIKNFIVYLQNSEIKGNNFK